MQKKPLTYYINLIESALNNQDVLKAKQCGEFALRNLHNLACSPDEKYTFYMRLGRAYIGTGDYSRSLDIIHKAYVIAIKHQFTPAHIAYALFGMGTNYLAIKSISQALTQYQHVEQHYLKYGSDNALMTEKIHLNLLLNLVEIYLYKNETEKARKIIEEQFVKYPDFLSPHQRWFISYMHVKGEYFRTIRRYDQARQCFCECLATSEEINIPRFIASSKIHLAMVDLLEGHIDSTITSLLKIIPEARGFRLYKHICEAGLMLSKCYSIKGMNEKSNAVERQIKPYLNKIDITWFYEKAKEYEELYRQLQHTYNPQIAFQSHIPEVISNRLNQHYESSQSKYGIIGKAKEMTEIYTLIEKIAPTDLTVLIHGETGTGKELVARAIYQNSLRKKVPWIAVNCGAMPETLLENTLFGHVKGAFTDAKDDKKGYIELASEGTLFMDEIGDMSINMQQKLLRVLEEKQVWRLGSDRPISVNARFVFASNQNIEDLVRAKKFREDLYYRINTIVITLPPLRDRKDDIPLLAQHFLNKYMAKRMTNDEFPITNEALDLLIKYNWSGNIRELENEIKRICALHPNVKEVTEAILSESIRTYKVSSSSNPLKEASELAEKNIIMEALKDCNDNITHAARKLGCTYRYLHRKIVRLNIQIK